MLRMVVAEEPADPLGLTDESLANSLSALCENPFAAGLVKDKDLFYAAALKLMDHKRQNTRAEGIRMLAAMPLEDFHRVADRLQYVIKDRDLTYHSYHNPTKAVGSGIAILAGFNIKEGLDYTIALGEMESGKGSFKMRAMMDSLARYGANARPYMEELKQRPGWQKVPDNPKLRGNWENLINAIEEDKEPAKLITIEEAKASNHTNP
jgi:hypothetical protein